MSTKGSASNLAARPLASAAEALELASAEGRLEGVASLVTAVKVALDEFEAAVLPLLL